MNLIAFDLEGPLSPNDHAYELMALHPHGARVFEVISRYDDLLALEGKPDYEPGDTLALIVPFLLHYRITEAHIRELAQKAMLTPGAAEVIAYFQDRGWRVLCITTTYRQYALSLTERLGISPENVAATSLPLEEIQPLFSPVDREAIAELEEGLLNLDPERDDALIKERLDRFYWEKPSRFVAEALSRVKPVGGRRKVEALRSLAPGQPFSKIVFIGDSITDWHLLEAVNRAGGLAIAFNANRYALPHATAGLAAPSILPLQDIVQCWLEDGREGIRRLEHEYSGEGNVHLLGEGQLPLEIHLRYRRLLRSRAAELG